MHIYIYKKLLTRRNFLLSLVKMKDWIIISKWSGCFGGVSLWWNTGIIDPATSNKLSGFAEGFPARASSCLRELQLKILWITSQSMKNSVGQFLYSTSLQCRISDFYGLIKHHDYNNKYLKIEYVYLSIIYGSRWIKMQSIVGN